MCYPCHWFIRFIRIVTVNFIWCVINLIKKVFMYVCYSIFLNYCTCYSFVLINWMSKLIVDWFPMDVINSVFKFCIKFINHFTFNIIVKSIFIVIVLTVAIIVYYVVDLGHTTNLCLFREGLYFRCNIIWDSSDSRIISGSKVTL